MIRKKLCILISLLFFATGATAQSWTTLKQIESIQVMGSGGFMLYLEESEEDVDAICKQDEGNIILFYPDQVNVTYDGIKALISTALIAYSTANKVNVMFSYSLNSKYCRGHALKLSK
ncbi:MAG: hypothetical protein ISR69_14025 [Gammaproteobacteria bacterium]|nr:hypothetical protein [Gammaproteobacteria bacterium]